ncbi:MAG: zinc-ribbon domain-containing protein [Candidatus Kariarchaeaceae archaeon]|jgi:DNA-directed RNA polymerase subunit RPC12/RpoP
MQKPEYIPKSQKPYSSNDDQNFSEPKKPAYVEDQAVENSIYCPECGTKNNTSAIFCGNCGFKLN